MLLQITFLEATCIKHSRLLLVWQLSLQCYHLLSFSYFHLRGWIGCLPTSHSYLSRPCHLYTNKPLNYNTMYHIINCLAQMYNYAIITNVLTLLIVNINYY